MSVSVSIDVILNSYKNYSVIDIVKCLLNNDWTLYNANRRITFLPADDKDKFDWQEQDITEENLFNIIDYKHRCREIIGLELYYKNDNTGISLLFFSASEFSAMCSINRKIVCNDNSINFTDVNWYIKNIIVPLKREGFQLECFKFEEC